VAVAAARDKGGAPAVKKTGRIWVFTTPPVRKKAGEIWVSHGEPVERKVGGIWASRGGFGKGER
jgi:hypothetical protein